MKNETIKSDEKYKSKIGFGKTTVKTQLPFNHPVVEGVILAKDDLGGSFPEHVRQIIIDSGESKGRRRLRGNCSGANQRGSTITIFAKTIVGKETSIEVIKYRARRTTLHEVGHSEVAQEIHSGIPETLKISRKKHEEWAKAFASKVIFSNEDLSDLTWDKI